MAVLLICPNLRCRKVLAVPDEVRAKMVKCQHCSQTFRVPDAPPPKKPETVAAGKAKR
jgi:hypothetical protein